MLGWKAEQNLLARCRKNRPFKLRMIGALVVFLAVFFSTPTLAATFTVVNTNDSGVGSLRQAIIDANALPGLDTINFDVAVSGGEITLLTTLPEPGSVILDGTTANDVQPGPDITIVGDPDFYGTVIFSSGSGNVMKGIAISGGFQCFIVGGSSTDMMVGGVGDRDGNTMDNCTFSGINNEYTENVTIYNNVIGLTAGNGTAGLGSIGSSHIIIGGAAANQRNIIVNNGAGMRIGASSDITIKGNYIGTATGFDDLGNTEWGILTEGDTENITIGGSAAGEGNVISGNGSCGIANDGTSINAIVQGNYLGVTADGSAALPNGSEGIRTNNSILLGGTVAGAGNVISGNGGAGVLLQGGSSTVQGNYIGTNPTGTVAIPNGTQGIWILASSDNLIGGTVDAARNIISGNTLAGIDINSGWGGGSGNFIENNYIGTNAEGTAAIPNGTIGVYIVNGAQDNFIGLPGYGNVISGNTDDGIRLEGATTTGNSVQANIVGLAADGTTALGNGGDGIQVWQADQTLIGSSDDVTAKNIIASNGVSGIYLDNVEDTTILNNYIGFAYGGEGPLIRTNAGNGIYVANGSASNTINGITDDAPNIIVTAEGTACFLVENTAGDFNEFRGNDCVTETDTTFNSARNGDGNEAIADPTITALTATTSFVEGTAIANGDIDLYANGLYVASGTSDDDGNWSIHAAIPSGARVSAAVTNANHSTSRTVTPLVLVVDDEEEPGPPTITSPPNGSAVSSATPTLTGTKPAYTSLWVDGIEWVANNALTTWTIDDFPIVAGSNNFVFTTQDLSLNESDDVNYTITRDWGITVTETGGTTAVTEGAETDTYTVVLDSKPEVNVKIKFTFDANQLTLSSATKTASTSTSITLTFTPVNWNTVQTVTVAAVNDDSVEGDHESTITAVVQTADPTYTTVPVENITTNITDNDSAGVSLTETDDTTSVATDTEDTYTLVLDTKPANNVTITILPDDIVQTNPSSLVWTTTNWNVPQTVTVTTAENIPAETSVFIQHAATSSDPDYDDLAVDDVVVRLSAASAT
ncbi:MAG: Na-Ca exchanger/integrin-beta4 [uncultured bacterium]|nr:MAG: Na-Ca exchanger/integrin-beta4 [uncultured bacterium]